VWTALSPRLFWNKYVKKIELLAIKTELCISTNTDSVATVKISAKSANAKIQRK